MTSGAPAPAGDRPLLSVLIPTWRRVEPVVEAVRSVGVTDAAIVEIVVVDNGSEEPVYAALAAALAPFPNVALHRNESNLGMVRNWNRCIGHARGRWMGLLCSDDVFVAGGVARALRLLSSLAEPALVVADPKAPAAEARLPAGPETSRTLRLPIASGNFWHRDVCGAVGGFDERFEYSADAEFWYRCARRFPVVTVRDPFASYREHLDNYMWATWGKEDFLEQSGLLSRTVLGHQFPELAPARVERTVEQAVWKTALAVYSKTLAAPGRGPLARRYGGWLLHHAVSPGRLLGLARVTLSALRKRLRRSLRRTAA
jgi:hypothetical protein